MGVSRRHLGLDTQGGVVAEHAAIVYAPRKRRDRFPQGCVEITASEAEALRDANPAAHRYPAIVLGPSRSSEGQMLYYLVRWLGGE
jgi:hypothetical protein